MLIDDEEGNVMDIADDADRLQTLLYSAYDSDTVREMERPLLDDGVPADAHGRLGCGPCDHDTAR